MPTNLPGPSSLARMQACIRSVIPPHADSPSEYAEHGNAKHEYLANVLTHGREKALMLARDEDREWLADIDTDALPASKTGAYAPEVSWALDMRTGKCRVLGQQLSRKEARFRAMENEVVGTADLAGLRPGTIIILDYKSGWLAPAAKLNPQLLAYAVMGARAYSSKQQRITQAEISIVRAPDDAQPWVDTFHVDEMQLDVAFMQMRQTYQLAEKALQLAKEGRWDEIPPAVVGPHCRYCPRFLFCEAQMAIVKAFTKAPEEGRPVLPVEALTDDEFLEFSEKLECAETVLEQLRIRHDGRLRQRPIPLGDGLIFGEKHSKSDHILPKPAREALMQLFGPALGEGVYNAAAETVTKLPKERLRSALRALVLPGLPKAEQKITKLLESTMDELRERQAVSPTPTRKICRYKGELPLPKLEDKTG